MESLTQQTGRLLWLMKSRATEEGYQFAWQKNGKMFVRKRPQDPVIRMEDDDDLISIQ